MKDLLKKPIVKNILSAIAVAVFGFALLNLVFIIYALFQNLIIMAIEFFMPPTSDSDLYLFPPLIRVLSLIIIGIISWFVFKLKINTVYKAIYMTVPLAAVFVTIGIFLSSWHILVYLFGALFSFGVLYYFYRTKQSWIYYYTLILIALVLLIMNVLRIDI
jgi:hypothetical protein